jgi:PTH1 family peptidyl-tRNA hydrolase
MEYLQRLLRGNNQMEQEQSPVYLIVGLGNPGREYRMTRHNIGFMAIDTLASSLNCKLTKVQFKAIIGTSLLANNKIILAKPQTFMNLSGQAVSSLMHFYKIPPQNLMIINDDIDLPLGTVRIRPAGGSAGQKGIESIIARLGTQDFPRLRLGIGRPPGQMIPADYVLQSFSSGESEVLQAVLDRAVDAVKLFVSEDLDAAMNKFNGRLG